MGGVEELFSVLSDSWSESKSKEDWQEEYSKHYALVENGSISEFSLILDVLLFHFKRSKSMFDSKEKTSRSAKTNAKSCPSSPLVSNPKAKSSRATSLIKKSPTNPILPSQTINSPRTASLKATTPRTISPRMP